MPNISFPNTTFQIVPASQLASVQDQKILIVGQMLAAGTATAEALIQDHPNDGSENTLFGRRSHLAGMVREFKAMNEKSRLDIIPLDDSGTAVDAEAELAITGAATEAGTIEVTLGSEQNHKVSIAIAVADTASDVGDAIVAAFDLDLDAPFTTANVTGTVTATAENGGSIGNDWTVKVEGVVAGIAIALTGWASGANDPVLTSILDVIANIRYQTVVWPSVYDLTTIEAELNDRFNVTNDVLDGVAIQTLKGTASAIESAVSALNSQSLLIIGNKTVSTSERIGTAVVEMPDIISSEVAALRSLRLTEGALLTQFVTTVSRSDQYGGIAIASLPYANTLLPNIAVPKADDFFTASEIESFRDEGVSIIGPNRAYNEVLLGEFVTTYLTNAASVSDDSYKFLNTVDTASVIREFFYTNFKARYAQTRLTDGDLIAGRDMANESSIRAFANRLYVELSEDALVQSGTVAKKDFDDNMVIAVTVRTGTVEIDMAPLLVSQLRIVLGTIQINFGS